jgi:hypothetical protein
MYICIFMWCHNISNWVEILVKWFKELVCDNGNEGSILSYDIPNLCLKWLYHDYILQWCG